MYGFSGGKYWGFSGGFDQVEGFDSVDICVFSRLDVIKRVNELDVEELELEEVSISLITVRGRVVGSGLWVHLQAHNNVFDVLLDKNGVIAYNASVSSRDMLNMVIGGSIFIRSNLKLA